MDVCVDSKLFEGGTKFMEVSLDDLKKLFAKVDGSGDVMDGTLDR
jgi:hypothetical protein